MARVTSEDTKDSDAPDSKHSTGHQVHLEEEERLVFDPSRGNVVFASAYDNWAFTVGQFAALYSVKLKMNPRALRKALWGEYFYIPKQKKVVTKPQGRHSSQMFVQFVLDTIWKVYDSVLVNKNAEKMKKIISTLGLRVPHRELTASDWRTRLRAIFARWLPIPRAVLGSVVLHTPSPIRSQVERVPRFWTGFESHVTAQSVSDAATPDMYTIRADDMMLGTYVSADHHSSMARAVASCDNSSSAPVLVYISKLVDTAGAVADSGIGNSGVTAAQKRQFEELRRQFQRQREEKDSNSALVAIPDVVEDDDNSAADDTAAHAPSDSDTDDMKSTDYYDPETDRFFAFARIFSGTLDANPDSDQKLFVFGPKYDPADPSTFVHRTEVSVSTLRLYLVMGRDLEPITSISAGNLFGIRGLSRHLVNVGTLSSAPHVVPFNAMAFQAEPIVRVAIEPRRANDMKKLVQGLKLLNQADPNVHVLVQEVCCVAPVHGVMCSQVRCCCCCFLFFVFLFFLFFFVYFSCWSSSHPISILLLSPFRAFSLFLLYVLDR
jgi:ribosome assembly protein 1